MLVISSEVVEGSGLGGIGLGGSILHLSDGQAEPEPQQNILATLLFGDASKHLGKMGLRRPARGKGEGKGTEGIKYQTPGERGRGKEGRKYRMSGEGRGYTGYEII